MIELTIRKFLHILCQKSNKIIFYLYILGQIVDEGSSLIKLSKIPTMVDKWPTRDTLE